MAPEFESKNLILIPLLYFLLVIRLSRGFRDQPVCTCPNNVISQGTTFVVAVSPICVQSHSDFYIFVRNKIITLVPLFLSNCYKTYIPWRHKT